LSQPSGRVTTPAARVVRQTGLVLCLLVFGAAYALAKAPTSSASVPAKLKLLKGLSVVQQTTDYTCGPAIAVGVARYLGLEVDELTVAREMGMSSKFGTNPQQMAGWFISKGVRVTAAGMAPSFYGKTIWPKGSPALVEWIDGGGHWVVMAGIDDKGAADPGGDDIIFADP
jgi:predicted double-glycine peptidase